MRQPSVIERISDARTALILDHAFYGALALKLAPVESTRTNTMATDGRSLFYCADFVAKQSDAQLIGLLAHEVMHPAMQHHARREGRDPSMWNEAADYAINPLLIAAGFTLPDDALLSDEYAGMSAEQIYRKLQQRKSDEQQEQQQGQGRKSDEQQGQQQGQGQGAPQAGTDPADMPGAIFDAPDQSDAGEWEVAVEQAVMTAKMMGQLPADMERAIEQQTAPKVDWRALLRRFVQQCAAADYSWKMPNRRYISGGIYLPELRSEALPAIVVAVDTSGSIGAVALAEFGAEIQAIADECQPAQTIVIYADARVRRVDTFERGEAITIKARGGGGTDFRPVFDHCDEQQIDPACLIYLTDGEGSFPDLPPAYPVLWAMTSRVSAPWGETVQLNGA